MDNMFCFQCEQTAKCAGCTGKAGVCGKPADTAKLQDKLTGAVISLSGKLEGTGRADAQSDKVVIESLFTTITNVNFNSKTVQEMIDEVHGELARLTDGSPSADYDMKKINPMAQAVSSWITGE